MPAKGSAKGRKIGRNKVKCKSYELNRSKINKLTKLSRHNANHPNDSCAKVAYGLAKAA